jgi:hypothetical protein
MIGNKHHQQDSKGSLKKIFVVHVVCLFSVFINFILHVIGSKNSMINFVKINSNKIEGELITDGFLPWAIEYHKTLAEFVRRPITSFFIDLFSKFIEPKWAFVVVNYGFLFFCGLLIYFIAKHFGGSFKESILNVLIFYFSFTILFAFFIPIATFDEPAQYFFVLLSYYFILKRKYLYFVAFFSLAIIARESSLFLLPFFMFLLVDFNLDYLSLKKAITVKNSAIILIPIVVFCIYLFMFYENNPQFIEESKISFWSRFSIIERNFYDVEKTTS